MTSNLESALESAKAFLAKNASHGKSHTTCLYISVLLDVINKRDKEIERLQAVLQDAKKFVREVAFDSRRWSDRYVAGMTSGGTNAVEIALLEHIDAVLNQQK